MDTLTTILGLHDFRAMFREELGWNDASTYAEVSLDASRFRFEAIAQQCGFPVLHCTTSRVVLADRILLHRIQRKLAKVFHEHIAIYSCLEPPMQVWQWTVHLPDGRRLKHSERPFLSASPPEELVHRLQRLRFTPDEGEGTSQFDALSRVRAVLDRSAKQRSAKRQRAREGDRLARAMQQGGDEPFHEFVLFHRPLARRMSRWLRRWFDMDGEDAEQIAFIGLIQAARRFKPELGYKFSTYASHWIRRACQRYGPATAPLIRLPPQVLWSCFQLAQQRERLLASHGSTEGRALFEQRVREEGLRDAWSVFSANRDTRSLSDREQPEFVDARQIASSDEEPWEIVYRAELTAIVREAIQKLRWPEGHVVRLRYGIGAWSEHTLEEIGAGARLTRQRIGQIQSRAEERLSRLLRTHAPQANAAPNTREADAVESDR